MSSFIPATCCAAIAASFLLFAGCGDESTASADGHAPAAKSDHGGGGHGGGHGAEKKSSGGHGAEKKSSGGHGGGHGAEKKSSGGHGAEKKSSGGHGGGHGAEKKSSGGHGGGHGAEKKSSHGGGHGAAAKSASHASEEKGGAMQLLDGLRRTPEESVEVDLGTFLVSRSITSGETLRVRFQLTALVDAKQEGEFNDALAARQQAMRDRVLELSHKLDLEHFDDPTLRALKSDLLVEIQRAVRSLAIHEVLVSEYVTERR